MSRYSDPVLSKDPALDGEFALGRCRVWKMHHAARPSKLALTPSVHEVK